MTFDTNTLYDVPTPDPIREYYPKAVWSIPGRDKVLYLTFDDGPIPEVTPWVLEQLAKHDAKATFFCVGENVIRHPVVFDSLKDSGQAVGNHTHNHMNGWRTEDEDYFENIRRCAEWVDSNLFRPPYGCIKPSQYRHLLSDYQIIMWDVLVGDYDRNLPKETCLQKVIDHGHEGSVIALHDSIKAQENLVYTLPRVLEHFSGMGFVFHSLRHLVRRDPVRPVSGP